MAEITGYTARNLLLHRALPEGLELRIGPFHLQAELVHYTFEAVPGDTTPHRHPHWELSWMCRGTMHYYPTPVPLELHGGDGGAVLIPPYLSHWRRTVDPGSVIFGFMLYIHGDRPELERAFRREVEKLHFRLAAGPELRKEIERLLERTDPDLLFPEADVSIELQRILLGLFRRNFSGLLAGEQRPDTGAPPMKLVENYISENLSGPIPVDELARFCHLSRRQLYRWFEREYRMPVSRYIRRRRLQQAAAELLSTARPLKEIAENNGFPNLSYFNRQFKLQYTIPPGVYRRHNSWSAGEKEKLP